MHNQPARFVLILLALALLGWAAIACQTGALQGEMAWDDLEPGEWEVQFPQTTPQPYPQAHTPTTAPTEPVLSDAPSEAAQLAQVYISQRYHIPEQWLAILADHPTEYPGLGRQFQVVTLLDTRLNGAVYKLLVDLANGEVIEDLASLAQAEAQAQLARFGKLEVRLAERLALLQDEDTLPVAIWIAAPAGKSLAEVQQEVFLLLATRYPEARTAMENSGKPMDVPDRALSEKIYAEYLALVNAAMDARAQPLAQELQSRGFVVISFEGMPSLVAILPKSAILELAQRPEVSAIYLVDEGSRLELEGQCEENEELFCGGIVSESLK